MSKHLVDRREPTDGGRLKQFLRLARDKSDAVWSLVKRQPRDYGTANQRAVQFARIARGRQV